VPGVDGPTAGGRRDWEGESLRVVVLGVLEDGERVRFVGAVDLQLDRRIGHHLKSTRERFVFFFFLITHVIQLTPQQVIQLTPQLFFRAVEPDSLIALLWHFCH